MNILNLSKNIESIVNEYDLDDSASHLKNEYAISKTAGLAKLIEQKNEEGRLLKIGIVGRVKAGKSSLLNSLVFNGESILPKAATPMTAALTILEYSEDTTAEVEFFNQEDIDNIKENYDKYRSKHQSITSRKKQEIEIKEKQKQKRSNWQALSTIELDKKAEKQATRELASNESLVSAYDQYRRMKESGISLEDIISQKLECINAEDTMSLNEKLFDYVGSSGKYMPFTRSVTLKLNEESLKDIQIIDTPGINDPVSSREERTKELLKFCDVVLIVSPAGQFLSNEDTDLFDRISSKEGINNIYIVASQADSQLMGGEKNKANGLLPKALDNIRSSLTQHMKSVLDKNEYLKNNSTFTEVSKGDVLLSSSVAYSLLQNFDQQSAWDSNEQHVWKLLTTHYKDYFDTKEGALANLALLANINKVKNIIKAIKVKKDQILQNEKEQYVTHIKKNLMGYKKALQTAIEGKLDKVKNTDINQIKEQKKQMEAIQDKASATVNNTYRDLIESLEIDLKSQLNDKLSSYFKKSKRDLKDSEGSETETYERYTGRTGFLWLTKNYETVTNEYTTVKAGFIRNSLDDLTSDIEDTVESDSRRYIKDWRKSLFKSLVSTLRETAGDENLDISLISQTIRKVVSDTNYPEIDYSGGLPKSLRKSGTLTEEDAEEFIEAASNYISSLRVRVKSDIKSYLNLLTDELLRLDIAEQIFKDYKQEIEEIETAIENKTLTLEKYKLIIRKLEAANE